MRSLRPRHPIYDCVYLALAECTGRMLVIADHRFLGSLFPIEHAERAVDLAEFNPAPPS